MLIHWYCRKLLRALLKQIEDVKKYRVQHKYDDHPDTYLFQYRGYQKKVGGCCCRSAAAYQGLIYWLERNKGQSIRSLIKRSVKLEKKSFERKQRIKDSIRQPIKQAKKSSKRKQNKQKIH